MRVYLDTSVLSAILDPREPSRQSLTEGFWLSRANYECMTSDVSRGEIVDNPDLNKRQLTLDLSHEIAHLDVGNEAHRLAEQYVFRQVFTRNMDDDALHVACATVASCPVLLSWNFRHLVNRRRRLLVNLVNGDLGYPSIDILTPPEV